MAHIIPGPIRALKEKRMHAQAVSDYIFVTVPLLRANVVNQFTAAFMVDVFLYSTFFSAD